MMHFFENLDSLFYSLSGTQQLGVVFGVVILSMNVVLCANCQDIMGTPRITRFQIGLSVLLGYFGFICFIGAFSIVAGNPLFETGKSNNRLAFLVLLSMAIMFVTAATATHMASEKELELNRSIRM